MTGISKEALLTYLRNEPLVQAIRQKADIDRVKAEIHTMHATAMDLNMSAALVEEVAAKLKEYQTISKNYGNLIEDSWQVTWQMESVIRKYLDCSENELPDFARF